MIARSRDRSIFTPVHTNRTPQALRKEGLIELAARSLRVLDWRELREVGDSDELYLHQHI